MYAEEIDQKERYLGYAVTHIPNTFRMSAGEPEYVKAVAYWLGESNLIVKMLCPVGGYRYWHLKKAGSSWRAVDNTAPDPGQAIEKAVSGLKTPAAVQ